jgi:NADH:ubiquinone oxidoreductase subunit 5 (subunit L)/multisubunit Na+/H+ antiporter MnhA subunit
MNRIADVFFIFGILLLLIEFKTTDYFIIFSLLDYIENNNIYFIINEYRIIDIIAFFLFLGAIGKSAQLGLHT